MTSYALVIGDEGVEGEGCACGLVEQFESGGDFGAHTVSLLCREAMI
jgi:hypothetical protein